MLIENSTHPLVSDFLGRVTGFGDTYFNVEASSRINDFIKYISALVTDNGDDFAFYPLRREQNIGKGNQIFGVGNMASGTNIIFPRNINWSESGIILGRSINDVGIINFSGKLADKKFQFRRNPATVFYFLKHNRPKFEDRLYRPGELCPYFWFDDSRNNFGIVTPEFSTSDLRTTGTTYIYDDIYGGDKKGYQMEFSSTPEGKFGLYTDPTGRDQYGTGAIDISRFPPVSFYEMDDNNDKFVCMNTVIQDYTYSLRSFFGKDYRLLTGAFPPAYAALRVRDPVTNEIYTDNLFPRRMVIGAGVSNDAVSGYDTNGVEHICAGILILQGDYTDKSRDIAENMAEAIGIKVRPPEQVSSIGLGNIFSDNASCSGTIKSINYYDYTTPRSYETYSDYDDILKFETTVYSGAYIDYGRWTYNVINATTGELRSPDKVPDTIELTQVEFGIFHDVGQLSIYPPVFGSFMNRGVAGFVSGLREKISDSEYRFTRFESVSDSGSSGFYLTNNNGQFTGQQFFPPKKEKFQSEVTGYISGINYELEGFVPFNESSNLYSSGYFMGNNTYTFPKLALIPQYMVGYISGFLFENGIFSGFDNNYLDCSSGYFYANNQYEFLPKKVIQPSLVTGFLLGVKSGDYFSGYYQSPNSEDLSGVFMPNDFSNPAVTGPTMQVYFPTGGMFSGFDGLKGFDARLGFNYSGFFSILRDEFGDPILDIDGNPIDITFNGSSGFVDLGTPGPFMDSTLGLMTGIIGTNNYLNFSGNFDGFNNIDIPNTSYGYAYSGFFVSSSGFLGTQIDPITQERNANGTGIFTGLIGHINTFEYVNLTVFDDEPEFLIGGLFTGFFAPTSTPSFSGIYGLYGTGIQTGIIGSKFFLLDQNVYSGLSGFSQFSEPMLENTTVDLTFPNGSGFSGLNGLETGFGVMSGLITTGRAPLLFGDPVYFRPYIISISFDSSSINFYTGDYVFGDLTFTGAIPDITGLTYVSGLHFRNAIDSGTNTTGDYIISGAVPEIIGLNYFFSTASYVDFFDFNSRDYIFRVEEYEGQQLESGVRVEINKFISGLKADNIWDKISDACLLAGPRTVSGIFIPLKNNGKTGINYNFVSGDYSRASGLLGDGSSKYIDTQHLLNQESTGSQHMAVYITQVGSSSNQYYIGAGRQYVTGSSAIYASGGTTLFQKSRASGFIGYENLAPNTGLMATSRYNTGVWVARNTNSSETAFIYLESGAQPANVYVFANNDTGVGIGTAEGYSNARMAMYSMGTNIDILKLLENRIYSYLTGISSYIN